MRCLTDSWTNKQRSHSSIWEAYLEALRDPKVWRIIYINGMHAIASWIRYNLRSWTKEEKERIFEMFPYNTVDELWVNHTQYDGYYVINGVIPESDFSTLSATEDSVLLADGIKNMKNGQMKIVKIAYSGSQSTFSGFSRRKSTFSGFSRRTS